MSDKNPIIQKRPYRNPYYSITDVALLGGGKNPKPGEISLAHNGVLFLDEFPEFSKRKIELLRGPIEDSNVNICRINTMVTYPSNFILVASMNPCPCGYYGSEDEKCSCTPEQIRRYMGKISGPILDRIDLQIEVKRVKYESMEKNGNQETSESIKNRVNKARNIQIERYKNYNIYSNAELTQNLIYKYCKIDEQGKNLMEKAFEKLKLSVRAYDRILKVARTIADLEEEKDINAKHLAEAIQYRNLDRKYFH